jgi:UDP-glucuronate decarboxylase
VDDLVDGAMRLMNTPDEVTGPINVGNPVELTIRELAETVLRLTGSRSPLVYRPLPHDDPMQRCPDITLEWEPRVQLEQGLARTIEYFDRLLARPPSRPAVRALAEVAA